MDFNLSNLPHPAGERVTERTRLLIIGAGPAGFSAALYAARADLNPIVLTGLEMGGQVALTYSVENYPGFPEGVGGQDLVEGFKKQAERFGARLEYDSATEVDFSRRPFKVHTYGKTYLAEAVIVTTGASSKHLNVPGEKEFTGRGVSYCATCDGAFFKDKRVIVVGGGDSALEEGLFLTRYAASVTIVHRRAELRAGAVLEKRARTHPKIHFIWNSVVTEVLGDKVVQAVRLQNLKTGEECVEPADGVFIFIGHTPNTELFKGQLEMDDHGYIEVDRRMHTNVHGVFAAGEAADPDFRQVITSAGMGAAAAMQAGHYLDETVGYQD